MFSIALLWVIVKGEAIYSSTAAVNTLKPDVLAPGTFIVDNTPAFTGTSFAAPFVTGVIAALSEKFEFTYITDTIKTTATSIGLAYNEQGSGLIQIEKLIGEMTNEEDAN